MVSQIVEIHCYLARKQHLFDLFDIVNAVETNSSEIAQATCRIILLNAIMPKFTCFLMFRLRVAAQLSIAGHERIIFRF